ncbi:uncharacterized protein PAC_12963 [Phialocephala subalpina]|uniref:Uncharacterized protein n=1 Tax=Phialocephala subalpina TaxID=576137 RepID=A0A1L7XDK0_9HELO|nr:uncharacterized protein PAC_12963 [Phialocephala subalpina]
MSEQIINCMNISAKYQNRLLAATRDLEAARVFVLTTNASPLCIASSTSTLLLAQPSPRLSAGHQQSKMDRKYEVVHGTDGVEIKHTCGVFKFSKHVRQSLEFNGTAYWKDVGRHAPLKTPLLTKRDTIKVHQPPIRGQSHSWWQAQCAFRGLATNGTLDELANRAKKLAQKEMKVWEANAKENSWLHTMTDSDKMVEDPERFLKERFKAGEKSRDIVLIHLRQADIRSIAQSLDLECEIAREAIRGFDYAYSQWVSIAVVGQDKAAVAEKVQAMQIKEKHAMREMQKHRQEEERQEKEWAQRQKEMAEQKLRDKEAALKTAKDSDPTGTWEIKCPYIVEQWGHMAQREDPPLSMEIFMQNTSKGPQMFATFDFIVVERVMRFERQASDKPKPAPKTAVKAGTKRPREDVSDEGRYDSGDERRSPTPEPFYLGPTPFSAKHPTWKYRYRGKETGESEILIGEDENVYHITLQGPKGRTLKGNFGATIMQNCTFTGVKVEAGVKPKIDIGGEWAAYNESAYNRPGSRRWGGW